MFVHVYGDVAHGCFVTQACLPMSSVSFPFLLSVFVFVSVIVQRTNHYLVTLFSLRLFYVRACVCVTILSCRRFSRVVDCCVYFIQHANIKSKTLIFRSLSHSLVTLLTGQAILQPRDAALASLDTPLERAVSEARSAGADVYPVRQFYKAFVQTSSATAAGSQREYRSSSHSRRGTSDHRFSGQRGTGMAQRHSEGAPQRRRPRSNSLHKPSPATPSDPASISADLTRRGSRGQPREGRGGGVHSGGRGRRGNKG